MIFETKDRKNRKKKYGIMSSLFLGTLLVFFVGFFTPNSANAEVVTNGGHEISLSITQMPQNPPVEGFTKYQVIAIVEGKEGGPQSSSDISKKKYTFTWFNITDSGQRIPLTAGDVGPPGTEKNYKFVMQLENSKALSIYAEATDSSGGARLTSLPTAVVTPATQPVVNGLAGFISGVVGGLVMLITGVLYGITYYLVIPIIQVILSMKVHDSSFSAVILGGWVFVRNIMNIFFILTMLIIALATLFRVDEKKYGYKHLIPELVLMAVLINFSLVIAQLILGVADTLQAQFLPDNQAVLGNLAYQMMVKPNLALHTNPFSGSYASVVASVFYLFFALASFFSFLALAAFLVIRVVMLWVLLLLSPVAYGLRVLPSTHHESSEWWSQFLKYAFFTPLIGFFLHIAATLTVSQADYMAKITQAAISTGIQPGLAQFIQTSLSTVLVIFFLYIGIEMAEKIGGVGVKSIIKRAEHYTVKPFEFAGESIKDYGTRAKSRAVDNLVRDEKGNFREGKAGVLGRGLATALTPIQSINAKLADTHHATEFARDLTKAQVQTVHEYRTSKGTKDIGKDKAMKKKHHDEEVAPALKRNTTQSLGYLDQMRTKYGVDASGRPIPKNEKAVEETLHQMEAMVIKKNLEFAVKRFDEKKNGLPPGEGVFDRTKIIEFAQYYSNGDHEVEHEILETIAKNSEKHGYLAGVAVDKSLTDPELDIKLTEVVYNTDPAEILKINPAGVDKTKLTGTVNAMKAALAGSGRTNLPKNLREFTT